MMMMMIQRVFFGLGPRLWDKPISLPVMDGEDDEDDEGLEDDAFDVMNMEDFLLENNIRLDDSSEVGFYKTNIWISHDVFKILTYGRIIYVIF